MKTTTHSLKVSIQLLRLAPTLIVVALTALCTANARANTIVFNTLGPGDTYSQINGYQISGNNAATGIDTEEAAQFTAGASGFLATVDLGLGYAVSPGLPVSAYLYGDASGSPDNANQTLLGSGTPTAEFGTTNNSIVSIAVAGNVPVTMGSLYWLVLKPANPNAFDFWNLSLPPITGNVAESMDHSPWDVGSGGVLPAFRITAQSPVGVPDSASTWTLLLLGLTAVLGLRRFVRQPV